MPQKPIVTVLTAFLFYASVMGQSGVPKDTLRAIGDTPVLSAIDSLKQLPVLIEGTTSLIPRIETYTQKLNKANALLNRGFDTLQISEKLVEYEDNLKLITEFIESQTAVANHRSLSLSIILLTQMERRLKQWQETLSRYSSLLMENNALLLSISVDSVLKIVPRDSVLRVQYDAQIELLYQKTFETDTLNKANIYRISYLQNRVSMDYLKMGDLLNSVKTRSLNYSQKIFDPEFPFISSSKTLATYDESLYSSIKRSVRSNSRVYLYYSKSNALSPLIFLIAGLLFYWWTLRAVRRIKNTHEGEMKIAQSRYLGKAPLTCAIVVTFTLAPFVYANPPMLYTEMLMMVTLLSITWFSYRYWDNGSIKLWIVAVALFLFFGVVNLLVTTTYAERWIFLLVSIFSVWYGIYLKRFLKSRPSNVQKVGDIIVTLFIVLQAISVIANIAGRYSLAKICSVTATFGLTQGFVIFYFIQILLEAVYLELESHRNQSGIASFFDFQDLDKRLRSVLIIFGVILWTIITLRNLNVYDFIYSGIEDFLVKDRTLGSTSFTFWSIVVFIIVLVLSMFLSKMVGYIFGNPQGSIKGISKGRIGSSVLLIRLGIYTIGIIVAFVASGIPVDKLTIIIGALGVGIGFGLQNVVNNLVSGVILAFEKPIQIGDIVEVGTRTGVVNEIGIRSSKITTYEGSTVIIPNGDLIAQHIINWTHGNKNRRIEVLIGVAYGSEVNLCQDVIEEVMDMHKFIMKDPKPLILLQNFGNSSIDFRVLFWTQDIARWIETRSEVMAAVYGKFAEKGIAIPFPQQDLHIRSIDPDVAKSFRRGE